ncbi:MAG: hypothetical protein QM650_19230 [Microlunatus sp.]
MRECLEKQFTDLLDVQFWLMGRDVEHPAGNLLVELGLTRERPADPELPSRYTMAGQDELAIVWRCGLLLSSAYGDVLCVRGLAPRRVTYRSMHDLWDPRLVRAAHLHAAPCQPRHLAEASAWFTRYEAAVRAKAGVDHRSAPSGLASELASHQRSSLDRPWAALAELASSRVPRDVVERASGAAT